MASAATIRGGRTAAPALLVLAVLVLVLAPRGASAALSCSTVYNLLMPCLGYVQFGGVVPPACCDGIKKLVSTASSSPDRRTICTCLEKVGAGAEGGPYRSRAAGVPGRCNAPLPYETWPNFNCDSIN